MNTTTNTRGVYHAAHVKAVARALQTDDAAHYAADAAHMLEDYAAALEAALSAEPAQGEAVHQYRHKGSSDWYDGVLPEPDDEFETRTLYTAPPAQPAERVPEGWVLVPREPTEAMRRRGADRWIEASENAMTRKDEEEAARCAWAAMLAAAPADGKEGVR